MVRRPTHMRTCPAANAAAAAATSISAGPRVRIGPQLRARVCVDRRGARVSTDIGVAMAAAAAVADSGKPSAESAAARSQRLALAGVTSGEPSQGELEEAGAEAAGPSEGVPPEGK
jgi:hypothetical protein